MPHLVIRPASFWRGIDWRDLGQYRDLLLVLGGRDIKLRYRQTVLGVAWVVLQPLIAAGIFALVFGRIARLPADGVPYFVFAYSGFLGWNAFQSTLTRASNCIIGNASLVSKVYFPRLILPLSTLFSSLIDFAVGLALIAVLLPIFGVRPGMGLLLLPVWLVLLQCLALGIGLYAAGLAVRYRDVQHLLPVLTQFLMYASPVAYGASAIPPQIRGVYMLNPLAGLLEAFRWSLLGRGTVDWANVGYAAAVAVAVLLLGAMAFRSMEAGFADVI